MIPSIIIIWLVLQFWQRSGMFLAADVDIVYWYMHSPKFIAGSTLIWNLHWCGYMWSEQKLDIYGKILLCASSRGTRCSSCTWPHFSSNATSCRNILVWNFTSFRIEHVQYLFYLTLWVTLEMPFVGSQLCGAVQCATYVHNSSESSPSLEIMHFMFIGSILYSLVHHLMAKRKGKIYLIKHCWSVLSMCLHPRALKLCIWTCIF